MKNLLLIITLFLYCSTSGQEFDLNKYSKYFENELKPWTNSYSDFDLSQFKKSNTSSFDNNYGQSLEKLKSFLSIYKPIITFTKDSSKFIDIYSYELNLEKKGKYFIANPDIDQCIYLCSPKIRYWNRICFIGGSGGIDEVIWLSNDKFILVGGVLDSDGKRKPLIYLGDTINQSIDEFIDMNLSCAQKSKGYYSPKLKRLNIKGM